MVVMTGLPNAVEHEACMVDVSIGRACCMDKTARIGWVIFVV